MQDKSGPQPPPTIDLDLEAAKDIHREVVALREHNRELRKSERALNALMTVIERSDRVSTGYGEDPLWKLIKSIESKQTELSKLTAP